MPPKRKSTAGTTTSDASGPPKKSARVRNLSSTNGAGTASRPDEALERTPIRHEKFLYQIFRSYDETTSWDTAWDNVEEDVLYGTFSTLEEANKAAKELLLKEWDRDCFESYDITTDEEGFVTVDAVFIEGETAQVVVKKVKSTATPVANSTEVWIVSKKKEEGEEEEGWETTGVFQSMAGAVMAMENKAAELYSAEMAKRVEYKIVEYGQDRRDPAYVRRIEPNGEYETVLRIEKWPVKS